MPGGYSFDHVETLKMIDRYYNSKFKSGNTDSLGFRKFFFNVVKPACDIASKFVDLDTRDIILVPEGAGDEIPTWFMQKKLKRYLKEDDFACLLNELGFSYPKYGHVILKKSSGLDLVNIQNIRVDPAAKDLKSSPFVYEVLSMTRGELEEKDWDTKDLFARGDDENFIIYDCYDLKGSGWTRTVYGDLLSKKTDTGINRSVESEINSESNYYGSLVLYQEDVTELPYRELVWEKVPGRWLGYGFVEYLEENQIAINEAENLERKGLLVNSLALFQTRDETIGGSNILSNATNGDILTITSEVAPITMEARNLAAFNNTRANWSSNIERKTFTSDITTGANLPSRTPLGVAQLQSMGASTYFELKRENFGIFVSELVSDDIIPSFEKETLKEHTLMFSGSDQDVELLDKMISDATVNDAVVEYALKTGFFPSQQEKDALRQRVMGDLKKTKNRYIKIPKGFYKNADYYVDINITGENMDNGTKSQVLQLALQIVGTNPGIIQNPVTKNILMNLLSLGGISGAELGLLNDSAQTGQMMQQGQPGQPGQPQGRSGQLGQPQVAGSMAKPTAMPGPMMGMNQM